MYSSFFGFFKDELRYDTGYLPQFHLLKLEDGDLTRLYVFYFLIFFLHQW
jgi:hypothetical protein